MAYLKNPSCGNTLEYEYECSIPFSFRLFPQPQRREPHKGRAKSTLSLSQEHIPTPITQSAFPNLPQSCTLNSKTQKNTQCRTQTKVSPIASFLRLVGVIVAWRIGLCARSMLTRMVLFSFIITKSCRYLFLVRDTRDVPPAAPHSPGHSPWRDDGHADDE